jgi:hypothetical protein
MSRELEHHPRVEDREAEEHPRPREPAQKLPAQHRMTGLDQALSTSRYGQRSPRFGLGG